MKRNIKLLMGAVASSAFLFFGANTVSVSAQNSNEASVFALHASPDTPAVDIFIGSTEVASNLEYGDISSAISVPAGSYDLDFFAAQAGATRPTASPIYSGSTPSLQPGSSYLAIAGGLSSPSSRKQSFRLIPLEEDFTQNDGNRFRFIHASPDAPALNIGIVGEGTVNEVATNVTFGSATPAAGIKTNQAPAVVTIAPTSSPDNYLKQFTVNLQQGGSSTIFGVIAGKLNASANEKSLAMHLVNPVSPTQWNVSLKGAESPDIPGQSTPQNQQDTPQDTTAEQADGLATTGTDFLVALGLSFVLALEVMAIAIKNRKRSL